MQHESTSNENFWRSDGLCKSYFLKIITIKKSTEYALHFEVGLSGRHKTEDNGINPSDNKMASPDRAPQRIFIESGLVATSRVEGGLYHWEKKSYIILFYYYFVKTKEKICAIIRFYNNNNNKPL